MRPRILLGVVALVLAALALAVPGAWALTPQIHEFPEPSGKFATELTAGPDGNLWFIDVLTNAVGRMTLGGTITEFPVGTLIVSIAPGPDGNMWITEENANAVARVTPAGAITPFTLPTPNSHPWSVAPGPGGTVWFSENSANKVGFISTVTHASVDFPIIGAVPTWLIAGPDGNVWFAEDALAVGRATPGGVMAAFALPQPFVPRHLAVGSDRNIWFVEGNQPRVDRITPQGVITSFPAPTGGGGGIAAGSDGALWFTDATGNAIDRITPGGSFSAYPLPVGHTRPSSIALGPDGNVWFTEVTPPSIGRITTPPAATTGAASGVSRTRATVAGTLNGHAQATTFRIEYGRTTAYGSRTPERTAGSGAANVVVHATLARLAAGTTYHYRLVATNPTGATAGADATFTTAPAPPARPRLSRLRVSPATLHPPHGVTISYRDSVAATTTITVLARLPGVRRGHRCVRPPRHRAKHAHVRRCTRSVSRGRLAHRDVVGANRVALGARLGGSALAPGRYLIVAVARAGSRKSAPVSASFAIAR